MACLLICTDDTIHWHGTQKATCMLTCLTWESLQVLREDKLLAGFQRYIGESLGGAFTQGQPWTLDAVLPDTHALKPTIFILTAGADPTAMLQVTWTSCGTCILVLSAHTPNMCLG